MYKIIYYIIFINMLSQVISILIKYIKIRMINNHDKKEKNEIRELSFWYSGNEYSINKKNNCRRA